MSRRAATTFTHLPVGECFEFDPDSPVGDRFPGVHKKANRSQFCDVDSGRCRSATSTVKATPVEEATCPVLLGGARPRRRQRRRR